MRKLIHYTLKYLWVIRARTDSKGNDQHRFNLWNPLGWLLLLLWAAVAGLIEGCKASFLLVKWTVKDSI